MSRRIKALVLTLASMLLLTSCDFSVFSLPLPGGPDTGDEPIEVTAEFDDVLDLVPQSTVKVDDVDVGRITDIRVDDYTAVVDMEIRNDTGLPADAVARIRQTSLLGEKFVSLEAPEGSSGEGGDLADGAMIPIERTGRNPEVEEVLGALSLLLNGGGIGQLQTITRELNLALDGREPELRSALNRLNEFATVADDNSDDIIAAIDSLNELSKSANEQTETINLALDELPSAALSLDRQRDDLVEALTALDDLSDVGVRVIRQSKEGTIRTLELLEPVLRQLANADDDLAFSIQTLLTFPFVDAVVGEDPQVARDIAFGDYVNLDIQLDLRLGSVGDLVDVVCDELDSLVLKRLIESGLPLDNLRELVDAICNSGAVDQIQQCLDDLGSGPLVPDEVATCLGNLLSAVPDLVTCDVLGTVGAPLGITVPGCDPPPGASSASPFEPFGDLPDGSDDNDNDGGLPTLPDLPDVTPPGGGSGGDGGSGSGGGSGGGGGDGGSDTTPDEDPDEDSGGGGLGDWLGGLFGRTAPNQAVSGTPTATWHRMSDLSQIYDADLTALLVPTLSRGSATPPSTTRGGAR